LGVQNDKLLGYKIEAFYIIKNKDFGHFNIEAKITKLNFEKYKKSFSNDLNEIISLIFEYDDESLHKIFCKNKKLSVRDFIKNLNEKYAKLHIQPFIEKRVIKILDIIRNTNIELYYKDRHNFINKDDRIFVIDNKADVVFNITKKDEGTEYFLTIRNENKEISLLDKSAYFIANEPCRLVLENRLYYFEKINAKKILPFLKKDYIKIPSSSEKLWYESFALKSIQKHKVRAKGFTINKKITSKKAVLVLENDLYGNAVLVLQFEYNNLKKFFSNKERVKSVKFRIENNEYIFDLIDRDDNWEKSIIDSLNKIGLKNFSESYFLPVNIVETNDSTRLYYLIAWLRDNVGNIEKSGVSIEQKKLQRIYSYSKISIEKKIKEENDWFDLYIEVVIGKYKFPFIMFKKNIVKNIREFILPNNEVVILPEEWFTIYKDVFTFGNVNEDSLRIDKHHYKLLEDIDKEQTFAKNNKIVKNINDINDIDLALPMGLNANLRTYQEDGYKWMRILQENGFGGCLADDMGLGKTIQTLAILINSKNINCNSLNKKSVSQLSLFNNNDKKSNAVSLIVMPVSLVHNWVNEIKKFAPSLRYIKYLGNDRKKAFAKFYDYDIVITSYGLVRNDIEILSSYKFSYIILDESQYIKNSSSKIYKAVTQLNSDYKLVLTGTPIENSLSDLWSQINFLNEGLIGNFNFFKKEFVTPIEKNKDEEKANKLKKIVDPFILRRTKKQVAPELPPKIEQFVYCDMNSEQKKLYDEEKSVIRNSILEKIENNTDKPTLLAIEGLTRLRQISNHPKLFDEKSLLDSGKFDEITRYIDNITAENNKVLIFSAYVKHLDLIADYLNKKSTKYSVITGKTRDREAEVKNFQDKDSTNVFLIQIKAGGVGLNLTAADYVFIIDPWWNPAVEEQAINRAHRIGRDGKVMVYRFITTNSIEEKIQRIKDRKAKLAETFISTEQAVEKLDLEKIMQLLN
ncbi:MAG: DEAD/DEAH box helicase, partial [Bacteroidota bacterium]|nr:DEAD/DEAH box helicase [Bacteroidota bacterium]